MTLDLSKGAQSILDRELSTGDYMSVSEVVEIALRDLAAKREREETMQAIREGVADAEAGRMYSVEKAFEIIRRENPYLQAD